MPVAVIDIGSNSVKLLIADRSEAGAWAPVYETSRTTRLGEGIHVGRLREIAMRRTLEALTEFKAFCTQYAVSQIAAGGTSALRDAANQSEFIDRASEIGIGVQAIPGEEEARLSFLAVRRDPQWKEAGDLLVIDIGGGSTETVRGVLGSSAVSQRMSVPMGAVRLTESSLTSDPPTILQLTDANNRAKIALAGLPLPSPGYMAVGVGGTFTNLAAINYQFGPTEKKQVHGKELTLDDVENLVDKLAIKSVEQRQQILGLDPARADIILAGAIILNQAMHRLLVDRVAVSTRGMRWGLLYDRFGS